LLTGISFLVPADEDMVELEIDPVDLQYLNETTDVPYIYIDPQDIDPNADPRDEDSSIPFADPELTDEELFDYQALQLAYLVDILKNPIGRWRESCLFPDC
jgi:hypothetical protein